MGNNNEFDQTNHRRNEAFRMRPIFIVANLFIAIFLAILVSSFDSMSVRGGGFSVYAGPSDGSGESFDENGDPIQGASSVILVATNTPTLATDSAQPSVENEASATVNPDVVLPGITATPEILEVCDNSAFAHWVTYVIQPGDTLGSIARLAGTDLPTLQGANCLNTTAIKSGTPILVPIKIVVVATSIPSACMAPPANWQPYTVQPGNNVFRISMESGISKADLIKFNCLHSESVLYAGQEIYLPPNSPYLGNSGGVSPTQAPVVETAVPSLTPVPSNTPLPTETATIEATATEEIVRPEMTPTLVTPVRPDETPTVTYTATVAPTEPLPTEPPAESPMPEPTVATTPLPADTPTPIPTAVPTTVPTEVPTQVATEVPTAAPTEIPTVAPTEIPPVTVIPTGEPTFLAPTATPIPTDEPAATPTAADTPIPAPTEAATLEPSPEP